MRSALLFLSGLLFSILPVAAQRKPVLPQIDLPHPYYYGEMYVPQLTSGPSFAAWSPDSKELVYSMAGSLWRQKIDSDEAEQLTDGPGYDYEPDWSPDGQSVVYCSYEKDAIELWLLDLANGTKTRLTDNGAVNMEPRWSPDGKRIVFVSTSYHGHFHIFLAGVVRGKLENTVRLTGETKSSLPRYYYSAYDHEISPVWTRDGKEILFISNRGHIHGTGGFWLMRAAPGAEAREIHYEETNWRARPDFSPDGSRMVYSSYLGRQWHQLWVMPAKGGDAFPVSYGDYDQFNVRWSPDGKTLAYVSNQNGNTSLWLQTIPGGGQRQLRARKRHYQKPMARLAIQVTGVGPYASLARVSVTDERGRFYAPEDAWICADDGYNRAERPFEAHYFQKTDEKSAIVDVPAGKITVEVMKGFEYRLEKRVVETQPGKLAEVNFAMKPIAWNNPKGPQWISADLHVHMNYGGWYRNDPAHLKKQAGAEDLDIVNDLIVNKEQRFPDIEFSGKQQDAVSSPGELVVHGQEFHTSYWGHRALLNIRGHILLPGYAGYPNTAAASLSPTNADVYDMAHAQEAIVGAAHPFDSQPDPFANPPQKITDELPVDVALGKLDYMEIVGFSDHRSTAAVWYRLLNLGFRIPAGAGTDAMANFAYLRGPVGMNRAYLREPRWPLPRGEWLESLKQGRTFATNGPLIDFSLGGKQIGDELKFNGAQKAVPFTAKLRSIVPVDHLEIVCNGRVARALEMDHAHESADVSGTLPIGESGWCVLRAWTEQAEYPVLDNYVYATTSPVYVTIAGRKPRSPDDAKYFVAWIDRAMEVTSRYPDWNSEAEKQHVLDELHAGKEVYEKLAQ